LLSLASFNLACRDHVPTFPQRSPPSLLTTAACSGLRPKPDFRPRRALLHLSYSCAPPFGPAMLVTHVESPGGISPPGAPRTVREPLDSHGSRCSAVGTRGQRLYLVHGLLPLPDGFSWPVVSAKQRSPFAPAPLQDFHHYYGLLRPCAPHRYSDPRGLSRL
jgi:hypothetical protein